MAFALASLLNLRRDAEDEAKRAFGQASLARAAAEAEQERLERAIVEARDRAAGERRRLAGLPLEQASQGLDREHYRQRLQAEIARAVQRAAQHRDGPLAEAQASEAAARDAYTLARQEREALDKVKARQEAEQRRVADRRAEDAAGDLAQAAQALRRTPT
jgi:flagellar biosynthesis chaperone FliJ